jgi:hypothetical protein
MATITQVWSEAVSVPLTGLVTFELFVPSDVGLASSDARPAGGVTVCRWLDGSSATVLEFAVGRGQVWAQLVDGAGGHPLTGGFLEATPFAPVLLVLGGAPGHPVTLSVNGVDQSPFLPSVLVPSSVVSQVLNPDGDRIRVGVLS